MTCLCYKIGGPFVAEDPDCEIHRDGGLLSRIEDYEDEIERLRSELSKAHELIEETAIPHEILKAKWRREEMESANVSNGWSLNKAIEGYAQNLTVPYVELRFVSFDEQRYFCECLSKDRIGAFEQPLAQQEGDST